jgi:DNA processing protein
MSTPGDTPTDDTQRFWAAVARAPCLHADHLRPAFALAGGPLALWRESAARLRALGLPPAASALLATPPEAELDADLAFATRTGTRLLPFTHADYPPLLAQIPAAPAALYVRGDTAALHRPQLALVGSRRPTAIGREIARDFARAFAAAGLGIASGLAKGIDAAGHEGALLAGGCTVAVCGTGLDRVYPAAHRDLAHRIAAAGALVSEFPPGTPPLPANFPRRNRILSGLALGTLVVEAKLESGSLITARCAIDQGREVFAVPGPIRSPLSAGCHELLQDGAHLATSPAAVLAQLRFPIENLSLQKHLFTEAQDLSSGPSRLDKPSEMLLDALGFEPASIDELVDRTGLPPGSIASMLLILELDLRIEPQPGGRYCRVR